jgi:indole-3-glycerol phosphate synthase
MNDHLAALVAGARRRVAEARALEPDAALRARAEALPAAPSFAAALAGPGVGVIAEIKRASPSRGAIAPGLDAVAAAMDYRAGGAAAISVLTEPDGFDGALADLAAVAELGVPALRKDFLVDPYQVWEARAAGAAAVLLIVAALTDDELAALAAEATLAGLDALVEVHDGAELARASRISPRIVGVNARDLRTFAVDPERFASLAERRPDGALLVAESGVHTPDDVVRLAAAGADAVLVGESVVTAEDRRAAVAELVVAGRAGGARSASDPGEQVHAGTDRVEEGAR